MRFFPVITVLLTLLLCGSGLLLGEKLLRKHARAIAGSESMTPDLVESDSVLGWRLVPGVEATHSHYDYNTQYHVTADGRRADTRPSSGSTSALRRAVLVGDSFAFGLGVADTETFAHKLDSVLGEVATLENASVPGYSTDQELLVAERQVLPSKPKVLWLAVFLGNDLLDNPLPHPLQGYKSKPFFTFDSGSLDFHSPDSPLPPGQPPFRRINLTMAILGEDYQMSFMEKITARSELLRFLGEGRLPSLGSEMRFDGRFDSQTKLFRALVERLQRDCVKQATKFEIILLAGRNHALVQNSLAARYQEYFRNQVVGIARDLAVPTIDVASAFREAPESSRKNWFYPNDGHLTVEGHAVVAHQLETRLKLALELGQ